MIPWFPCLVPGVTVAAAGRQEFLETTKLPRSAGLSCRGGPARWGIRIRRQNMNQANKARLEAIQAARDVCGDFALRKGFSAGDVGAAGRTVAGEVYTGICLDLGSGLGFCAGVAAVAETLKDRQTHFAAAVVVSGAGESSLPAAAAAGPSPGSTPETSTAASSSQRAGTCRSATSCRSIG